MLYVIHCLDHEGSVEKRRNNLDAHKAYTAKAAVKTLISGPLLADDDETMIGSMFIVEADDRNAVVAFNTADPLYRAGLWKTVNIHRFNKRVDNR